MIKQNSTKKQCYFGACNSYNGFVSYFDEIFRRTEFDKVFIIKGGPGTGKSSFMKRLSNETGGDTIQEIILCSSDPSSLDGVIIEKNNKKVAFLDGTAPHATETKFPGAKDEIVDLGKNWDSKILRAMADKIIPLAEEKKNAYSTAYSYLAIAGKCEEITEKTFLEIYDKNKSRKEALSLANKITQTHNCKKKTRLLSAFCKHGKYKPDNIGPNYEKRIGISGDKITSGLFLADLKDSFDIIGTDYLFFPSPLSPTHPEALYLIDEKIFISSSEDDDTIIESEKFCLSGLTMNYERTKTAESINEFALGEAKRWFGIASDLHFRLEEIYSSAMDFSKNDVIFNETMFECKEILKL